MDVSTPPERTLDGVSATSVQILSTEHWSLLATRGMTYNEVFSRTSIFLTVVSASVVALALVAQATDFSDGLYVFALLILPVVLLLGLGTYVRLIDANLEDLWLLMGMNRLRHAYVEVDPAVEQYFVTSRYDDEQGVFESFGPIATLRPSRVLASTPVVVGIINAVLAGVLAGILVRVLDVGWTASIVVGSCVAAAGATLLVLSSARQLARARRLLVTRFPR